MSSPQYPSVLGNGCAQSSLVKRTMMLRVGVALKSTRTLSSRHGTGALRFCPQLMQLGAPLMFGSGYVRAVVWPALEIWIAVMIRMMGVPFGLVMGTMLLGTIGA